MGGMGPALAPSCPQVPWWRLRKGPALPPSSIPPPTVGPTLLEAASPGALVSSLPPGPAAAPSSPPPHSHPRSPEGLLSLWGPASTCHRPRPPACLLSPSPVPGVHQVQGQHLPGLRRVRAWLRLVPEAGKSLTDRGQPPRGASRLACPPPFPPPGPDLLLCLWNCCLQECQHCFLVEQKQGHGAVRDRQADSACPQAARRRQTGERNGCVCTGAAPWPETRQRCLQLLSSAPRARSTGGVPCWKPNPLLSLVTSHLTCETLWEERQRPKTARTWGSSTSSWGGPLP